MPQATPIVAGEAAILARRYASALYELAEERKMLDAVAADLRNLRTLSGESAEFQYIAGQPRLSRAQLVKAMQQVAASAKLGPLTANFLALLAQNRRLAQLDAMIGAFLSELAARRGEHTAEVRTAKSMSSAQQDQLAAKLGKWAGGKVHLSVREDTGLLGGFVVRMGSRLIDVSVKSRLARLERQLKSEHITIHKGAA